MLLNCHSYYSFRYGTMSVEQLLEFAEWGGFNSFALTDINNTSASFEFLRLAQDRNLKPVVGVDFRDNIQQEYIGLVANHEGFRELNEHLTSHIHAKKEYTNIAPVFNNSYVIYPFQLGLRKLNENEFMGVRPGDLRKLPFSAWKGKQDKLVALNPITFKNKFDYNTHRLLRAIENNTLLSKLPKTEQAGINETILTKQSMIELYKDFPFLIENAEKLLEQCNFSFEFKQHNNKRYFSGSADSDYQLLLSECEKGIKYRYRNPDKGVVERMHKELAVIRDFGFSSYFLINWDIVNYAGHKNFYHVGRGSGANSLVAYLLNITNVDPIELDLYFERFINPYRTNPPDFDIDFSWTDRDDVTRYIFERHGYKNTALLGTYITFNHKSAYREIGKVFGVPEDEISRLQRNPNTKDIDEYGKWVIQYSNYINGFPSHLSIHASGILISEKPISYYSATELLPKNFPSTQFDMHVSEDIGLYKFDILSQRGLGKIKDALGIIKHNKRVDIDINDIPKFKKDKKIKQLLKTGKTIACFYVESPAMRMLLTKLKAEDYKRLVAASSIIRPGVARSGMMREYIERFQSPDRREKAKKALPDLYEILNETYGVMVYQEDVIKVAHYFAGLSLAEADVLRRGMSWKFRERNEFWKIKDKFFANCRKKKINEVTINRIWEQIESFANYAFSKGHSASYAVESFQALFLKAYFPVEYMVATLNNGGGFYRPELYIHEAKLHGAQIHLPCINTSYWMNIVEKDIIYLGFYLLKDMEVNVIKKVLVERQRNGTFKDLNEFTKRVSITLEQLIILIRIGAFNFTGKGKKELLWNAHFILGNIKLTKPEATLFEQETKKFELPQLKYYDLENAYDEIEIMGFSLTSPFALLEKAMPSDLKAGDLPQHVNKKIKIVGYLVHRKPTLTNKKEKMFFGTWLDKDGAWLDTVHFPDVAKRYPFRGPGCYLLEGKVTKEHGFFTVEVERMEHLKVKNLHVE